MDNSQTKLDSASAETKKIIDQAKKDSEKLVIELNEKFLTKLNIYAIDIFNCKMKGQVAYKLLKIDQDSY